MCSVYNCMGLDNIPYDLKMEMLARFLSFSTKNEEDTFL